LGIEKNGKNIVLSDEDGDGKFDSFAITDGCQTAAVAVEFNPSDKDDSYKDNYCVFNKGTLESIWDGSGKYVITVAGAATGAAIFFINPPAGAAIVVKSLSALGAALVWSGATFSIGEAAAGVSEYTGMWPS
jgi:hypothetical protein